MNAELGNLKFHIYLHNNVVDWDMDQFDKEANKSHYCKAYRCCHCNLLELFPVRLGAPFDQPYGVLHELPAGLHELHHLVHGHPQGQAGRVGRAAAAYGERGGCLKEGSPRSS